MKQSTDATWLKGCLILAIGLGICFRFVNLDGKVYWHDEVYTTFRAAGFSRQEIDRELFQNRRFAAPELLKFQHIKPGSTAADTVSSLATEDPQHPPLYFLMARGWMHWFGGSMTATRSLPALLSLLSLPLMYALGRELFNSSLMALLATTFLALSPFDILFAQTARQYSLLTVVVIGSSWLLLKAIRRSTVQNWGWYALSGAIGLYTHPFFGLTAIGHGVYVLLMSVSFRQRDSCTEPASAPTFSLAFMPFVKRWQFSIRFLMAMLVSLVLYFPWFVVLFDNYQRASATTSWTKGSVSIVFLVKQWILSFTALFIDLNFTFSDLFAILLRLPFIFLIGCAIYLVHQRTPRLTGLFILTSILMPFLLLALPDVVLGGQRSAASRYLISSFPGVQLAVAYLFAIGLTRGKWVWRSILGLVLASSLISCVISAQATTWWSKSVSYFNAEVAQAVNAIASTEPTILISDPGSDFTNTGDLISLSYKLNGTVQLFLAGKSPNLDEVADQPNLLLFRPSQSLETAIDQRGWQLEPISHPGKLWQIKKG
ncbi:glycosyl transferase family 39 [filamentous cyanobacterium CCP2]|nr:glycosyl transferase family 39 [filamentous cyanobacterium CCP2]